MAYTPAFSIYQGQPLIQITKDQKTMVNHRKYLTQEPQGILIAQSFLATCGSIGKNCERLCHYFASGCAYWAAILCLTVANVPWNSGKTKQVDPSSLKSGEHVHEIFVPWGRWIVFLLKVWFIIKFVYISTDHPSNLLGIAASRKLALLYFYVHENLFVWIC